MVLQLYQKNLKINNAIKEKATTLGCRFKELIILGVLCKATVWGGVILGVFVCYLRGAFCLALRVSHRGRGAFLLGAKLNSVF